MIEDELYLRATQELNSDERREDLWTRAIALASGDHDEARYLYTNLRVEELAVEDATQTQPLDQAEVATTDSDSQPEDAASDDTTAGAESAPLPAGDTAEIDTEDADATRSEVSEMQRRIDDMMRARQKNEATKTDPDPIADRTLETNFDLDEVNFANNNSSGKQAEGAKAANRHSKQTESNYKPQSPAIDADPLDSTEPEGFTAADNSLDMTAPDNLPPVQLPPTDATVDTTADATASFITLTEKVTSEHTPAASSTTTANPAAEAPTQPRTAQLNSGRAYTILKHSDGSRAAVKIGVSWPALLFTTPWLLYKKLWGTALVYIVMTVALVFATLYTGLALLDAGTDASAAQKLVFSGFALLSLFGLLYIPFRQGNEWVAKRFERRGYSRQTAINAQTVRDALDIVRR